MTNMDSIRYYLSSNVYGCVTESQVVILDLRRDKYLSLDGDASTLLRTKLDLLRSQQGLLQTDPTAGLGEVLSRLAANGILSTVTPPRSTADDRRPLTPPTDAIVPQPPFREHVSAHHAARYVASVISARSALRMRTLHRIVLRERRKTIAQSSTDGVFDAVRAALLCSVYSRLRVIATGPKQCLFDSLALKLFLAKYGLFPEWIFGVHLHPFAAHCWLQHGDILVNDSLDFVRRFTPIMAA
jgi:Transglutaminase-like superfamily